MSMLCRNMEDTKMTQIKFPLESINSIYDVTEKKVIESEDITIETLLNSIKKEQRLKKDE